MTAAKYFISIAIITIFTINTSGKRTFLESDVKGIIFQYFLVCGKDYLCNPGKYDLKIIPSDNYTETSLCPTCHCDTHCHSRGDCCPDLFFELPGYDCKKHDVQCTDSCSTLYRTVSTCPESSSLDSDYTKKCEDKLSGMQLLHNPPVTSNISGVSYSNRFCAYCNGELDDKTLTPWVLDISCVNFDPLNFLNSYEEVLAAAKENDCSVSYSPSASDRDANRCDEQDSRVIYDKCNMSGSWNAYDKHIKSACESLYSVSFGFYKNIFCVICNPPRQRPSQVIDTCKSINLSEAHDVNLWNACTHYPKTPITHPYKNIFCHLCNRKSYKKEVYNNAVGYIGSRLRGKKFVYSLIISSYSEDEILLKIKENKAGNDFPNPTDKVIYRNGDIFNLTNLILNKFSINPEKLCRKDLLPYNLMLNMSQYGTCWCDPDCLFVNRDMCCLDTALAYPITCISEYVHTKNHNLLNETTFVVTDGCYGNLNVNESYSESVRNLCIANSDSYASFPVSDYSEKSYINIFCHLCNTGFNYNETTNTLEIPNSYSPWKLELDCDEVLQFTYHLDVFHIVQLAQFLGCSVKFRTFGLSECANRTGLKSACNSTGQWTNYDRDIEWACENLSSHSLRQYYPFKNEFCRLCNPRSSSTDGMIKQCNNSIPVGPEIVRACDLLPEVRDDMIFPYKNVFCAFCNGVCKSCLPQYAFMPLSVIKKGIPAIFPDIFKVVHILDLVVFNPSPSITMFTVDEDHVYDTIKSITRNISCFPGRHLDNNDCNLLLPFTRDLLYTLLISAGSTTPTWKVKQDEFLENIKMSIYSMLSTSLRSCMFGSLHLLTNVRRRSDSIPRDTNILIYVQVMVSFPTIIDRYEVESVLLSYANGNFSFTLGNEYNTTFKGRKLDTSLNIPYSIQSNTDLLFSLVSDGITAFKASRVIGVSNLLTCKHVAFTPDEYRIDIEKSVVTIDYLGKSFTENNYLILPDVLHLKVCLEDVQEYILHVKYNLTNIEQELESLTLACTILSLACLFLTFVTYCICSELRTVPGQILMSLTLSLFVAQALFQFGTERTESNTLCQVLGVASHFFWLAVFSNVNCTCIHMYRRFANISMDKNNFVSQDVFYKYFSYAFILPACIVIMSIIASYVNDNTSGYGGAVCFLSRGVIFIVMFIVPITIICCANTILFAFTAYGIITMPTLSKTYKRNEVSICLRLFTITGITWLFQIIEAFMPTLTALSFFATILNGLQGCFIFFSFVCNRNVLKFLTKKFKTTKSYTTSFSSLKTFSSSGIQESKTEN